MTDGDDEAWLAKWLDAVADGSATMSQRAAASVERHGGIATAVRLAEARGVHLVELTDDKGNRLIAASPHPFRALC